MLNVKFKLLAEKVDAEGKCPIFLFTYYNGYQLKFSTKEKTEPKHWDNDKMRFRRSFGGYQEANEYLDSLVERIWAAYREYMSKGIIPTPSMLKNELIPSSESNTQVKRIELLEMFEKFIHYQALNDKKYNTIRAYKTTLFRIKTFAEKHGKMYVNEHNKEAHQKLLKYCKTEANLQPNSIVQVCKHLKTFFKICQNDFGIELSPNHAKITPHYVETERIFLTESDVEKIKNVPLSENMARVRDAFLFACYTGLRYSDWSRLSDQHIIDKGAYKVVSIVPQKTNSSSQKYVKRVEVPLLNDALEIIEKYRGQLKTLVPVLTNQKMNEYLKHIAMMAGIDELVEVVEYEQGKPVHKAKPKYALMSSHIARHTYATLSLIKGVPMEVLRKALGHSDIRMTMIYAKVVDEFKDRVILEAWNK